MQFVVLLAMMAAAVVDFQSVREIHVTEPDAQLRTVRLASWNIDRGTEFELLASELQRNPADLLLLQEVDLNTARTSGRDVAADLALRLGLNASFATEFEELGQEKQGQRAYTGQATLTRLPLRKSRILRFQRQSGFWKPHSWMPSSVPLMQRRVGSRIALVSELEFHGRMLVVYNAHLESRSAGSIQAAQLDEIIEDSQQYPPETSIVLAGDLNTKYQPSHFLRKLDAQGFRSAFGERVEHTAAFLALDWIFCKGPVRFADARVLHELKGSDHAPIYALLVNR
ncbi:MAG: endonuclease/exonuclease/phosphatase family protein [Acidobacteriaceae bacterium]|nr:endonuclease/exonuclease/phosphatase family protein [Acidobacteriaceae bacterium]MBV8571096.1 endonuclease/exonuclease/phosphatase family protein [Acidobacteriaceae bacterium]